GGTDPLPDPESPGGGRAAEQGPPGADDRGAERPDAGDLQPQLCGHQPAFRPGLRPAVRRGTGRPRAEDPGDVLGSGIEIQVSPPGKVIRNLEALSGGERALVAISIYFAILAVNPSPFCILDEIEAALDDANVTRFAQYLRRISGKTQFIVITHRRGTMEAADVLYGVTMQEDGISKLLKLDLDQVDATLVS